MGESSKPALRMVFDSRLKLEFHGSKVTSDAGLLACCELDAALGLADLSENLLNEVAVPREMFRAILEGIGRLRLAAAASG